MYVKCYEKIFQDILASYLTHVFYTRKSFKIIISAYYILFDELKILIYWLKTANLHYQG